MKKSTRLRAKIAAIGIAAFALTGAFNAAAKADETAPSTPQPHTITLNAANDTRPADNAHNARHLTERALELAQKFLEVPANQRFADPDLPAILEEYKQLLDRGLDPHFEDESQHFSLPGFLIELAIEGAAPDIIEHLIQHGADFKRPDYNGMNAVDHAIRQLNMSQSTYRTRIETAVEIFRTLNRAGAEFSDSLMPEHDEITSWDNVLRTVTSIDVGYQAGLLTATQRDTAIFGNPAILEQARLMDRFNRAALTEHGARFIDFPEVLPGSPFNYRIERGDTLWGIADRYRHAMGFDNTGHALAALAAENNIRLDQPNSHIIHPGDVLRLPIPVGIVVGNVTPGAQTESFRDLARFIQPNFIRRDASEEDILRELARLNKLDPNDVLNDRIRPQSGTPYRMVFSNPGFRHITALQPPSHYESDRGIHMVIIEGENTAVADSFRHMRNVYQVAILTALGMNADANISRIHAMDAYLLRQPINPNALRMLLNLQGSPLQDRLIFSHSMGFPPDERWNAWRQNRHADNVVFDAKRIWLEQLNESRPIIFDAAGNWYDKHGGRYTPTNLTAHSPRTVIVGSVGRYNSFSYLNGTRDVISPYSSYGADICAPLPRNLNGQMEGTSYATPALASVMRQFIDWYGDRLTFEEIFSTVMMTANRNLYDRDPRENAAEQIGPFTVAAPAQFRTNSAGVPYSARCGAGIADVEAAHAQLQNMVEMKAGLANPGTYHSHFVGAGPAASIRTIAASDSSPERQEYTYRIQIPEDTTLTRLTFQIPQHFQQHGDIHVRTPGGFQWHLPKARTDIVSTYAFIGEDVKAGDYIEITSDHPLGDQAGMYLRGLGDGNAIQLMRDHLQKEGILYEPLKLMAGNNVVGDDPHAPEPEPVDTAHITNQPRIRTHGPG